MKTEHIEEPMRVIKENFAGHVVQVKELEREQNINYLIRVGIAGPAGYHKKYRWNKTHFGLVWREKGTQKVGLFKSELDFG